MQQEMQKRKDKLFGYGVRAQPVVIVGELSSPTATHVGVDETWWKVASALKAVDIFFKAYHVLHASYTSETHA